MTPEEAHLINCYLLMTEVSNSCSLNYIIFSYSSLHVRYIRKLLKQTLEYYIAVYLYNESIVFWNKGEKSNF